MFIEEVELKISDERDSNIAQMELNKNNNNFHLISE